ncbi:MAG: aldehyde ferredoxin oxidoreductase family protein [Mycobacterium leprae]
MGRILWVDLTKGHIREEPLDEGMARDFIGGYGLGARILYERLPAHVDPLGPHNILGFVTGVLTGTPCIEGNRFAVVCKSPLTDTWGDSNCGGNFGPALKAAGFDAIFFTGQSPRPVYLHIRDGVAQLATAFELWGLDTVETEGALKQKLGTDAEVACIGPAGEKLSLISGIITDEGRAAGRSGVGAVMGAKRLKAVVVQGRQSVPMADPAKADALRKTYMEKADPDSKAFFTTTGTLGSLQPGVVSGDSPVKNWGGAGPTDFHKGFQAFDPARTLSYRTAKYGCWQCTLACGGRMSVKDGPYAVESTHKVEYETAGVFGTLTLNDDFESLIKCSDLCNRYGFDSISAGCTVAFAIECFMNGVLTKEQTGGLELCWGNDRAIVALLQLMGERKGIGEFLADGVRRAQAYFGEESDAYAIHIHGQEVPAHDPKYGPGLAVTFVMDATPGRHTQGAEESLPPGLNLKAPDRTQQQGRGELHRTAVCLNHVSAAAGICNFGFYTYDFQYIPDFLEAVTGEHWDLHRCLMTGERIADMRHLFNLREGLNPLTWKVPPRLLGRPPLNEGENAGFTVQLESMVQEYLQAMDWDRVTTWPSEKRLTALGLERFLPIEG